MEIKNLKYNLVLDGRKILFKMNFPNKKKNS